MTPAIFRRCFCRTGALATLKAWKLCAAFFGIRIKSTRGQSDLCCTAGLTQLTITKLFSESATFGNDNSESVAGEGESNYGGVSDSFPNASNPQNCRKTAGHLSECTFPSLNQRAGGLLIGTELELTTWYLGGCGRVLKANRKRPRAVERANIWAPRGTCGGKRSRRQCFEWNTTSEAS